MDIKKFDTIAVCDKGKELQLHNPANADEMLDIFIGLTGKDGSAYTEFVREATDERLRQEAIAARKGKKNTRQKGMEELVAEDTELLVTCTTGWRNIEENGQPVVFNVANCRRIYTEYPWLRQQVFEAIQDISFFLEKSNDV